MSIFAEQLLDLSGSPAKVGVRLFSPTQLNHDTWVCRFEIGAPINEGVDVHGSSSLQAVALGLKGLSAALYSHPLYREGRLGAWGVFGDYLGIPAPAIYQHFAPFAF